MIRKTATKSSNGHAGLNGRANGHAVRPSSSRAPQSAASVEAPRSFNGAKRGSPPPGGGRLSLERTAGSDDARGTSAAGAAPTAAACAGRDAYAEAATSQDVGTLPPVPGNGVYTTPGVPEPVADAELAEGGQDFVEAMHRLVNLYNVGKRFLESKDDKIAQRAWERLLEMRYGKGPAPVEEEPLRVDWSGIPRPDRD